MTSDWIQELVEGYPVLMATATLWVPEPLTSLGLSQVWRGQLQPEKLLIVLWSVAEAIFSAGFTGDKNKLYRCMQTARGSPKQFQIGPLPRNSNEPVESKTNSCTNLQLVSPRD